MTSRRAFATLLAICCALPALAADTPANGLQRLMLYRSFVQDDPGCIVTVRNGAPTFLGPPAASAAATCPDAFAWVQLAESVSAEFWNWGIDQTVWPASPLPLCTETVTTDCCDPNAPIDPAGPPPAGCPVFRADYTDPSPLPAIPNGTPGTNTISHSGLRLADEIDPGRLLRDLELELVFRNKPMVDYIYRNDLYNKEGLGARNRAQNSALSSGDVIGAHRMEVRLPVDAVMVKVDFIHLEVMLSQGLIQTETAEGEPLDPPNNPDYPYLTMYFEGDGTEGNVPGLYYVVAMTNASKDLPIWHWYAMEHVANRGRCDYIGCNDSFGYAADGTAQAGADFGPSYIPPMIVLNDDQASPDAQHNPNSPLFKTGGFYDPAETGEEITPQLQEFLMDMNIGTADRDPDPTVLSADDPAWLNYRLKGTQTSFTTPGGVPTGTGATVTEGGFVNSASCATCHSQASVDSNGSAGSQGVGASWTPNLMGFDRVEMGSPDLNWFYSNGGPTVTATQIDFIWGIFGAQCIQPGTNPQGPCQSYPDAPTIIARPLE